MMSWYLAGLLNVPSISLLCGDSTLYSSPYYTDGTITVRPIAEASWDCTGPICEMKHQLQLHLCVFLIHPFLHPSSTHPAASTCCPLLSSATRQIKSLSIMTQMRGAHLLCYLFAICNKKKSLQIPLVGFFSLYKHSPLSLRGLKLMVEMDIFPLCASLFLSSSTSVSNPPPNLPPMTADEYGSLCSSKQAKMKMAYLI